MAVKKKPVLTNAARPATFEVEAYNERGEMVPTAIAGEHPLTLYLDKREIVTLMTLGHAPEALAIGYLRNQRLVDSIEKTFVGCNGLTVTEEMRVVIAAYACLLVTNRPDVPRSHFYDDLFSILVYPTAFVVPHTHRDGHGVVTEGHRVLSGQAWDSRRIIVSWQDIEDGLATGHNVVLHEFAHYLDMEDETMDGAPGLGSPRAYREWSSVFWSEYDRLRAALGAGQPTFLDPYAASEPAEFFAVVTEAFFEKPRELEMQHAGLYEQLRRYYRVDPARWEQPAGQASA